MTLTNRLLAFLILSHAGLLAGFSVAVYAVARAQLYGELDGRNEALLDTLAATAEFEEDGWEWERRDRRLAQAGSAGPPVWALADDGGHRVDGSTEPIPEGWRTARRVIVHPNPERVPTRFDAEKPRYRQLDFTVASTQGPVQSLLATLAWSLAAGNVAILFLVVLGGRWWCRRALAPVSQMTAAVKGIGTESLAERVPTPEPRDELRELAEEFNALLTRVQIGFERQARFTGEASHQLRTPLAGMLGQLELALKRDRDPGEYRRAIAVAIGQIGHLNRIVEMLLFLARADSEAANSTFETVDLTRVIENHLATHWSKHPRFSDIAFPRPAGADSAVRTHPALFEQAFQNILENALKYGEAGSPIVIRLARTRSGIAVSVADRGRGIAADELEKIFAPFYRTVETSRSDIRGVGLGLSVARRIVDSLGGTIRAESELGRGSTFTIELPASDAG